MTSQPSPESLTWAAFWCSLIFIGVAKCFYGMWKDFVLFRIELRERERTRTIFKPDEALDEL